MAYLMVEMLVPLAKNAKMKVPKDLEGYDAVKYPHWDVFVKMQLGASLPSPDSGWSNARVVASLGPRKIRRVTYQNLLDLGFQTGYPLL